MALVVLLRGVNVGGHKTFRPTVVARELADLDVVNIGAAGTFVVRRRVTHGELREAFERRLGFEAQIMILPGRELLALMSPDRFVAEPARKDVVRFLSVLARRPRSAPPLPARFPANGQWLMKLLSREGRYVFGAYRRHTKAIGHFGEVDRLFGQPATTRNWNTVAAIAKVLEDR